MLLRISVILCILCFWIILFKAVFFLKISGLGRLRSGRQAKSGALKKIFPVAAVRILELIDPICIP